MIKQFPPENTDCSFTNPVLPLGMKTCPDRLDLGAIQKLRVPPHPSSHLGVGWKLVAAPLPLTECFFEC